jgi:predicted AAA+ superfamily ATPase
MKSGGQDDFGKLLENFVFITLLRKGFKHNLDFFYYKTSSGKEVDFLVLEGGKPNKLIQVCWSMSTQKTKERELGALVEGAKELNLKSTTIITLDETSNYKIDGIEINVIPVIDFINNLLIQ